MKRSVFTFIILSISVLLLFIFVFQTERFPSAEDSKSHQAISPGSFAEDHSLLPDISVPPVRKPVEDTVSKFQSFIDIDLARSELQFTDLHYEPMIQKLQRIGEDWQRIGFSQLEIATLFGEFGRSVQKRYCIGSGAACYDGASESAKIAGWFQVAMDRHAETAKSSSRSSSRPIYCETGFNFGKSTLMALLAGYDVYSFDVQQHAYSASCERLVNTLFPGRFTMVKGDSLRTVPAFHVAHPEIECDLVSIDGLHTGDAVKRDFINLKAMSKKGGTPFIFDDLGPKYAGGALYNVWKSLIDEKEIEVIVFELMGNLGTVRGDRDAGWGAGRLL